VHCGTDGAACAQGGDDVERVAAGSQGDLDSALLQMRAETLTRIDAALGRLDAWKYGSCAECGDEITERRLRALPFAVRCQACEEKREEAHSTAARQSARASWTWFPS
jgi:DnaK suppressor protein